MRVAVLILWASCLYSIVRSVLDLIWTASVWRQVLVLAVLALAASSCHTPPEESGCTPEQMEKR